MFPKTQKHFCCSRCFIILMKTLCFAKGVSLITQRENIYIYISYCFTLILSRSISTNLWWTCSYVILGKRFFLETNIIEKRLGRSTCVVLAIIYCQSSNGFLPPSYRLNTTTFVFLNLKINKTKPWLTNRRINEFDISVASDHLFDRFLVEYAPEM